MLKFFTANFLQVKPRWLNWTDASARLLIGTMYYPQAWELPPPYTMAPTVPYGMIMVTLGALYISLGGITLHSLGIVGLDASTRPK